MRLIDGLDVEEAQKRLGRRIRDAAEACCADGLASIDGSRMSLTTRGMLLENEVTLRLLTARPLALDMVEC